MMSPSVRKTFAAASLLLLLFGSLLAQETGKLPVLERLKTRIERVLRNTDGTVGVAVRHIESGRGLAVNGDILFPMASSFKVPILIEILAQAREGKFSLEDEISVEKTDQHPGSGMISALTAPGIKLSVLNMAHFMMMISDNSATDILLAKVGPANVNARLRSFGIEGMTVGRSCQEMIRDYQHMVTGIRGREERKKAIVAYGENPDDAATPLAMNALLEKIVRQEVLDPESCDLVISIMRKCETGEARIKGLLPPGTVVAHKTGTIAGTVNDCGLIVLPDGQGRIVLTVFCKDFTSPTEDVEALIAGIARVVYDGFYFAD
jgi:beta-lactamase class A